MTDTNPRALSALLDDLMESLPQERVPVSHLLDAFHERGFGFFLFFLALPMGLPLPVPPGVNIVLALPLILLTAQQAAGFHRIWLPKKLREKDMSVSGLIKILKPARGFVSKIEWVIRPRLSFVTRGVFSHLIGVAGLLMALSICVPLPLTNTVPSFGIAVMAAGVLMRDGLAVLGGMVVGLTWVTLLVFLGQSGLTAFLNLIG